MQPTRRDAYRLMHKGVLALGDVERTGIHVDVDYCRRTLDDTEAQRRRIAKRIKRSELWKAMQKRFGKRAKLSSNTQLASVLAKDFKVSDVRTTQNGIAVDEENLSRIDVPGLDLLVQHRKLGKAGGTYLKGILRHTGSDGILHPSFHLHVAVTYRSSSSDPNFQNFPIRNPEISKLIRSAFLPRKGRQIGELDYGGIEVCVAACYHKDPRMLAYIKDKSLDMHRDMAAECYKLAVDRVSKKIRYCGKNNFVFPQFYGSYYVDCAANLWESVRKHDLLTEDGIKLSTHLKQVGLKTAEQFEAHIKKVESDFWGKRFRAYAAWKEEWWEAYCKRGYFDTLTGFRCDTVMKRNEAINYPVQGSAFHCLLWSLIELNKELKRRKMKTRIIGQIHDSIVADIVPSELEDFLALANHICCTRLPQAWPWIIVPLEIEAEVAPIDRPWYEKQERALPTAA